MIRRSFLKGLALLLLPIVSNAAITITTPSTVSSTTTEANTQVVTLPTHNSGDILVIGFGATETATEVAAITGVTGTGITWTERAQDQNGTTSPVRLAIYTGTGNGTDTTATVQFEGAETAAFTANVIRLEGAEEVPNVVGAAYKESGVTPNIQPVTTTVDGSVIVNFAVCDDNDPTSTNVDNDFSGFWATDKDGYIETSGPGNGMWNGVVMRTQTTAGATDAENWDNQATEHSLTFTLAFEPSGGAPARQRLQVVMK